MKVGIFTFPNSTSYGATLQMYALYNTVNKLGHTAEIINYHNEYMKAERHLESSNSVNLRTKLKKCAQKVLHKKLYNRFRNFESKTMRLYPSKAFTDKSKLIGIGTRYDAVICGSDQVWNPDITDTDMSYFLDFCGEHTRRISYAPSFGIDDFSEEFCEKIRGELAKFHGRISVREKTGKMLIDNLLSTNAQLVIDPTLLVEREEWEELITNNFKINGEYILYYTVKGSKTLFQRCRELAEKTGLTMVVVGGNFISKLKNRDPRVKYAIDISPSDWLGLVRNARYVVTNSFHGTAFSIIFRKDFYLEMSSLTNSRLIQIVENFGLEDRVIRDGESITPSDVNYTNTDQILPLFVRSSTDYLNTALGEAADNG